MQNIISKEGFNFSFNPLACNSCNGNCCIGESGYIWVNEKEIREISHYLKIDVEEFKRECLIKVKGRYSIRERKIEKDNYECLFFKNGCTIYQVRPTQCRTYPFWDYFKKRENQIELRKECIGIIGEENE